MPTAPDSPELARPTKRGGRVSELAAVEVVPVWLEVPAARVAVQAEGRRPVLASGCGAVSTFLAEPSTVVEIRPPCGDPPQVERLHALFEIARRSGMVPVGRAVSGTPQRHGAGAAGAE